MFSVFKKIKKIVRLSPEKYSMLQNLTVSHYNCVQFISNWPPPVLKKWTLPVVLSFGRYHSTLTVSEGGDKFPDSG